MKAIGVFVGVANVEAVLGAILPSEGDLNSSVEGPEVHCGWNAECASDGRVLDEVWTKGDLKKVVVVGF